MNKVNSNITPNTSQKIEYIGMHQYIIPKPIDAMFNPKEIKLILRIVIDFFIFSLNLIIKPPIHDLNYIHLSQFTL